MQSISRLNLSNGQSKTKTTKQLGCVTAALDLRGGFVVFRTTEHQQAPVSQQATFQCKLLPVRRSSRSESRSEKRKNDPPCFFTFYPGSVIGQ